VEYEYITQFSCFTSTKVQILTHHPLRWQGGGGGDFGGVRDGGGRGEGGSGGGGGSSAGGARRVTYADVC
jgi:hypothetical protein